MSLISKSAASLAFVVTVNASRQFLDPKVIGLRTETKSKYKILSATKQNFLLMDRVSLWIDPVEGLRAYERVFFSFRPVYFSQYLAFSRDI